LYFLLFVWPSFFSVFCYSFAPYTYEISQTIARLTALQTGYKYFGIISDAECPLTTQIFRHKRLKFISHFF
jgi:hypothetical protein